MAFQSSLNRVNTFGEAGDLANGQYARYTTTTPRVGANDSIKCGAFAWVSDTNGVATAVSAASGKPTGIVQRVLDLDNRTVDSEGTTTYPAGHKVDVVVKGDIFVKTTDSAAVGKKLFVNNTSGAITCGTAGATVSGATETDWTVISLANNAASATGSIVIASNV